MDVENVRYAWMNIKGFYREKIIMNKEAKMIKYSKRTS